MRSLVHKRWAADEKNRRGEPLAFILESAAQLQQMTSEGLLRGVQARAIPRGYHLKPYLLSEYPGELALSRVLQARGVRGLILFQGNEARSWPDFPWEDFSAVCCNQTFAEHPVETVRPGNFDAMHICWRKAREVGARRIGLALLEFDGKPPTPLDRRFMAAFEQLQRQDLPRRDRLPILHYASGRPFPREWLEKHRPDTIIGFNLLVRHDLEQLGLRFPRDIRFATLITSSRGNYPDSSGCRNPNARMLEVSLQTLDRKLAHNEIGPSESPFHIVVSPVWQDGDTLG